MLYSCTHMATVGVKGSTTKPHCIAQNVLRVNSWTVLMTGLVRSFNSGYRLLQIRGAESNVLTTSVLLSAERSCLIRWLKCWISFFLATMKV